MQQDPIRYAPASVAATTRAPVAWWRTRYADIPLAWLVAGVALVLLVWFGTLSLRHLIGPDEGRYAEMGREMFASGDWVTLRYNALKYFEKPPLHMWVTALSYTVFGVGDWQARLCVALSGLLGLLAMVLAAHRWFGPRAALLTALALLASPMWSAASHFNTLDMTLAGTMSCVLACMLMAQHPDAGASARRGWMIACWAAMGAAVLAKGLVGIALPGLVLVVYTLAARDAGLWRRLHPALGVPVMLAVTVPWFALISARNPEFAHFFFIHEHWQRYTSTVHGRSGPIWYFVPLLLAGLIPWLCLVPDMWRMAGEPAPQPGKGAFRPALMAGVWAAAIFVFFSLSGSKLPGYILPAFPALGLLAGVALDRVAERLWRRQLIVMGVIALAGLLASPLIGRLHANHIPSEFYAVYARWVALAFGGMVAAVALAWWLLRRHGVTASIATYAIGMFLGFTVGLLGYETIGGPASGASIAPAVARVLRPGMPFYGVDTLDHTLPFYLRHPLVLVAHADELEFGTQQEPDKWIPDLDTFADVWQHGGPAVAVMSPETWRDLSQRHLPMVEIARDWRRVVVTNVPRQP